MSLDSNQSARSPRSSMSCREPKPTTMSTAPTQSTEVGFFT